MAIDVHGGTLSKVHLFNKIGDQALIRDLVLKLRSVLYLPGDFICRKVGGLKFGLDTLLGYVLFVHHYAGF